MRKLSWKKAWRAAKGMRVSRLKLWRRMVCRSSRGRVRKLAFARGVVIVGESEGSDIVVTREKVSRWKLC